MNVLWDSGCTSLMIYTNSRMKDVKERVVFLREVRSLFHSNQFRLFLLYDNNEELYLLWDIL